MDFSDEMYIDGFGFPIVDTSVQALSKLESSVNNAIPDEPLYKHYLEPTRASKAGKKRREWTKDDEIPFLGAH